MSLADQIEAFFWPTPVAPLDLDTLTDALMLPNIEPGQAVQHQDAEGDLSGPSTDFDSIAGETGGAVGETVHDLPYRPQIDRGIDLGNAPLLFVDTSAVGLVKGSPFAVDTDGVTLIARTLNINQGEVESSDTARIYVRFNSENNPWYPMSFNSAAQGAQKSDAFAISQRITLLWIYVITPTQDPTNQKYLILALTKGINLAGEFGSAGLTGTPAAPGIGSATQIGGGSVAPGSGPAAGGGGGGLPAGGVGGGGGPAGGGAGSGDYGSPTKRA